MGKLWDIIEDWRDGMAYPPSYRKIAIDLQVSQSSFDTWKSPTEMPKVYNLLAISRLTNVPYRRVVDAAVEDTRLYDEKAAEEAAERKHQDYLKRLEALGGAEVQGESIEVEPKPRSNGRRRKT
ncbi:MAG: hypothetical protein ABWX92_14995 [Mycetocola sp.]